MKFARVHRQLVAIVSGFCLILLFCVGAHLTSMDQEHPGTVNTFNHKPSNRPSTFAERATGISHGGCSRFHLPYNQIDTASLTGLSSEYLVMMPSTFWRYEDGSVRVTFAKTPKPCKGTSCEVPDRNSESEMTTVVEIGLNRTTNQCGLVSLTFAIDNSLKTSQYSEANLQYQSRTGSSLLRPPNLHSQFA